MADEPNKEQEIPLQGLAVSLLGSAYGSVRSKYFANSSNIVHIWSEQKSVLGPAVSPEHQWNQQN